ncbi:uncharacterized protein LOC119490792 isoform X2 [Sebastes umbrosus]|uniref:uncharacterized protein LOC119490792 isoform X2 n=1 Tax=Sebastes umbrosus TaxID=72105 RepID=UPI00189CBD13|nr:uncharacterized protein LOC119490792 isoform X2 [Sebastes umbrosus]
MGGLLSKGAAAKKETDFNNGKANDLTGNPNNTANTSQGLGPTQLTSHQLEPSNGNEAMLTRMHQVPAVDASQNREQSIHKEVNISQDADPVKHIPYLPSAVRVTQHNMSLAKPKDNKTSTPKPMLQQATPARPTAEPCDGVKGTAGKADNLKSDILQRLQDVCDELNKQQSFRPSAQQAQQQAKRVQHQRKQQKNRRMTYDHTQHKETTEAPLQTVRTVAPCESVHNSDASASVQVPAQVLCKDTSPQVECGFGSKKQQEMIPQLPASKMQAPVHHPGKGMVREEILHSKEAETHRKTKIHKPPSQKFHRVLSPVKEESTDSTCQATDETHDIAQLNTTTEQGIAEEPAAMPTKPPDHSRQMSSQPKAQDNNEENALHEHCLNRDNTTYIDGDYIYIFSAKSKSGRVIASKMRLSQKLGEEIKAQLGDDDKSSVATVQESPQQQGGTVMEENTTKKHNEPHQTPQPNKADNGSTCIQKVKMKTPASQVPVVEGLPRAAAHNPTTDTSIRLQHELKVPLPQDTAVRPKTKCTLNAFNQNQPKNTGNVTMRDEEMNEKNGQVEKEKQEHAISSAVNPAAEGRWHPFTVNQSCSSKARCRHNPGTGLLPNVQNCKSHLCPPQV